MDHISDILYNQENKYYLFMFSFVYIISVAYFISFYGLGISNKSNIVENEDYEKDLDDSSSVDSHESENEHNNLTNEIEYPNIFKLFSRLSKNRLIKIVGKIHKYKSKHEIIKLAIEKFKTYTIDRSLIKFGYFPKYIKMNAYNNPEIYCEELNQLFTSMVKEN